MYVYVVFWICTVHVHLCSADDKEGNEKKKWEKDTRGKSETQVKVAQRLLRQKRWGPFSHRVGYITYDWFDPFNISWSDHTVRLVDRMWESLDVTHSKRSLSQHWRKIRSQTQFSWDMTSHKGHKGRMLCCVRSSLESQNSVHWNLYGDTLLFPHDRLRCWKNARYSKWVKFYGSIIKSFVSPCQLCHKRVGCLQKGVLMYPQGIFGLKTEFYEPQHTTAHNSPLRP